MPRRRPVTDDEAPVPVRRSRQEIKNRQLMIFLLSFVGVAIVAIALVVLNQIYRAPFERPVVSVDNQVIRMRYFLDRARMSGDPSSTVQQLVYEEIVKIEAPALGITVSDSDIDNALHEAAQGAVSSNSTQFDVTTDAGFKSWYNDLLKTTHLSNAQYRDMIRTSMMAIDIQNRLAQNMPDTGEQVHLHIIVLGNPADAAAVKARLDAGGDFATLAQQFSIDTQTSGAGGDLGWIPQGVLPYDDTVFALDIGQISDPVATNPSDPTNSQYLIFMVSEKDPDRTIDAATKQQVAYNTFYYWLNDQMQQHTITYHLNADTQAWVQWQLSKNP